jgi:polar amino acid transport system permease protein
MRKKKAKITLLDVIIIAILLLIVAYFGYRINVSLHYTWAWGKIPQFLFRYDAESGKWVSNILM